MKIFGKPCITLITLLLLNNAYAEADVLSDEMILSSTQNTSFFPSHPELAEFEVRAESHKAVYSFSKEGESPDFYTVMVAKIRTHKPEDLKKFAVVQYIRGCAFHSKRGADGKIENYSNIVRQFFGKYATFRHKTWEIDSTEKDPVYWSNNEEKYGDRLGLYMLVDPMKDLRREDKKFMFRDFDNHTSSYIRDMPTSGSEYSGEFTNASMEFKTCVYKTEDLPLEVDPSGKEILGKEIACFNWSNNFIYNFEKETFEMKNEIHPFCLADF